MKADKKIMDVMIPDDAIFVDPEEDTLDLKEKYVKNGIDLEKVYHIPAVITASKEGMSISVRRNGMIFLSELFNEITEDL